jgi:hypothetical protein
MAKHTCQMLTPDDGLPCRHYIKPNKKDEPGFCQQPTQFFCTEAMKHKLPAISYSRLTDFIHCKMRYHHGVVEGLKVTPRNLPEAIKLGIAWDAFIRNLHDGEFNHLEKIQSLSLTPQQLAKISALMRAYQDLEIPSRTDGFLGCQYKIHVPIGQNQIIGYVDRAYDDHFRETKLSSRPDFYTQRENIAYQAGTYFMGNEHWEYVDVEITRVPALRTGWGKQSDETTEAYEERCYGDILSRPAHYFIGWNRKTRTYGQRFWRSEFDLEEIFTTYVHVLWEIQNTLKHDSWYANNLACHVPTPCMYLPIKRSGVMSEEIYERREVKQDE